MQESDIGLTGVLDEAYERLHRTGPEFDGYLSNHGPMASEALVQLGQGEHVHRWLDGYTGKLEERPTGSSQITADGVADALPKPLWLPTHTALWHVCAALTAAYAPRETWSGPLARPADSPEAAGRLALENGDEHIIKFTETALRAELRGLAAGRAAAAHALAIIPLDG